MTQVTLPEAQQRLPELLAAARAGEQVEIVEGDGWTYRIAAAPAGKGVPRAGSCKGLIVMADDFDAPLDELKEYME
jgi:antitoxin (DNA-binding transcriptional repressor) of toxin-antitoxin stability system